MQQSPWWYRRRDVVFGLIYGVGFTAGGVISSAMTGEYRPLFLQIGLRIGDDTVYAAMLALAAGCFAIRFWGSSFLHASIVWSGNARTDSLIVAGPFRYTRNPLYLGNCLLALSMGAFAPLSGWIVINLLNLFFVFALIRYEERGLQVRYGAAFDTYRRAVPALLPTLHPAPPNAVPTPSIKEGLKSEVFIGSILLGMIVLIVTPGALGFEIFVALYVIGIVLQSVIAGRSERIGQSV
jgi:protein-S-isoprenylcysteine O-methyltransferase Ste14